MEGCLGLGEKKKKKSSSQQSVEIYQSFCYNKAITLLWVPWKQALLQTGEAALNPSLFQKK